MQRKALHTGSLYLGVLLTCAVLIFPIYWLVITALSQPDQLRQLPPVFWPEAPRWSVLGKILEERPIALWLTNSALAALGAVTISMLVSVLAGYSLSRFRVRGGQSLGLFILTAKMLPATLLVIPLFGIFRMTGLIGSLWSIIWRMRR